jgi:hypothetical protein
LLFFVFNEKIKKKKKVETAEKSIWTRFRVGTHPEAD